MKLSNFWKIILGFLGAGFLAFLSFQYARIAHFPTGDDPAVHIFNIRYSTYHDLLKSAYPVPLAIFKWLSETFSTGLPRLFTLIISGFLFFSTISYMFLAKKISNSYLIAFVAAAIFATGAWVNDGLRMGLLAESFGWGALILALTALVSQNIPLVIISAGFLAFAHPFSFVIYSLVAVMYLLILFCSKEKKERNFALITAASFVLIFLAAWFFDRTLINRFVDFVNPEAPGWGERPLWLVLTVSDPRRILVTIFALIGIISSLKNWSNPGIKISYLLLFVGLFMSMNQIFGIQFLVFRFFPYLEMGLAIFAALGLVYFIEKIGLVKYKVATLIIFMFIVIAPHYIGNKITTLAQVNDAAMNNSMTSGDQEAILWIKNNIPSSAFVDATHKRAIWIRALTNCTNVAEDSTPFDPIATEQFYKSGATLGYDYIYFSVLEPTVPTEISSSYKLVYDKNETRIFKK